MVDITPESEDCECWYKTRTLYLYISQVVGGHELLMCVSGDQGIIHNLILDSGIIGQLASKVWKNKDIHS